MGIPYLNRFIREHCNDIIKNIVMSKLVGKKIAVDISIYMYKFMENNQLIENMKLMLYVFKHYNIEPIFIFDGIPPTEKKELLLKRLADKKIAEKKYNILKEKEEVNPNELLSLKKKFIYITNNDINEVKQLITEYNMKYIEAIGEADTLCATLCINKVVWGCLSEDTDMFVYGCPHIIKSMDLINHTFELYDMKYILLQLGITQKELREICVISGTDYNINSGTNYNKNNELIPLNKLPCNLFNTLKYFKKYKKQKKYNNHVEFYDWLLINTNYIDDINKLKQINQLFIPYSTPGET